MKARLWHSANRYCELEGDVVPRFHPVSTSFLVLTMDGRSPTVHTAYSEHGNVLEMDKLQLDETAALVVQKYRVSAEYNVPVVVVMAEPRGGFSCQESAVLDYAKREIAATKTREMKRNVIIPRVLVLPRRNTDKALFRRYEASKDQMKEEASKVLGFQLGDIETSMIRSICLAHCLGRSELGKAATPKFSKGVDYT